MPGRPPRFTEDELRAAITASRSWAETLRRLDYRSAGGNWKTLKKYAALWEIPTDHFDPYSASLTGLRRAAFKAIPLDEVLVENSTYNRNNLKRRLLAEGLKAPSCELCGQGERSRGQKLALILDHINGVPNDHRLENLRIVCPNCAATLETHCGRKNRQPPQQCALCGNPFRSKSREQRYCSRDCGQRVAWTNRKSRRKVERPPYEQLIAEIEATSCCAVGRKYGVSDNAIRKWVRQYRRERMRRAVRTGRMRGRVTVCLRV
ncbi:MAG: hypothetical protein ACRDJY_09005 [Thermoleophilaceae bacterium]